MSSTNRKKKGEEGIERYLTPLTYPRRFVDQVLGPWRQDRQSQKSISVLEPGCGNGAHLQAVSEAWPDARLFGVDIERPDSLPTGTIFSPSDYLAGFENIGWGRKFDLIMTNPPFSLTCQFVEESLRHVEVDGLIVMLQRVNFLASRDREAWWKDGPGAALASIHVIPDRPRFTGKGTDSCEYAYFVFEPWRYHEEVIPDPWFGWLWRTPEEIARGRRPKKS